MLRVERRNGQLLNRLKEHSSLKYKLRGLKGKSNYANELIRGFGNYNRWMKKSINCKGHLRISIRIISGINREKRIMIKFRPKKLLKIVIFRERINIWK